MYDEKECMSNQCKQVCKIFNSVTNKCLVRWQTMGHSIKKITPELTPFLTPELTPEITPNYVN